HSSSSSCSSYSERGACAGGIDFARIIQRLGVGIIDAPLVTPERAPALDARRLVKAPAVTRLESCYPAPPLRPRCAHFWLLGPALTSSKPTAPPSRTGVTRRPPRPARPS